MDGRGLDGQRTRKILGAKRCCEGGVSLWWGFAMAGFCYCLGGFGCGLGRFVLCMSAGDYVSY